MDNFLKGMSTIGELFPDPMPYKDYRSPKSAWEGVARSFQQAGSCLWRALKEYEDAQRQEKQTP